MTVAPIIHIGQGIWSKPPDENSAATLGHEIAHLFQGFIPSLSTEGEIAAYEVQFELLANMGQTPKGADNLLANLHTLWTKSGNDLTNYSDADITQAQDILAHANSPVYDAERFLHLGRPAWGCLNSFYGAIYGQDALSTSLNPLPIFIETGVKLRPRPTAGSYDRP